MPIFEYHCDDCGKDFERILAFDEEAAECRLCGGENIRRKFSRFSTRTDSYTACDVTSVESDGCGSCTSGSCATCGG